MFQSVAAMIDADGNVQLLESIQLLGTKRAIVTILDDSPTEAIADTALFSEASLAEDWLNSEEDAAWSYLQAAQ